MNQKSILHELEQLPGHIGFYVKDLATGETLGYHDDEPVEAASVIKLTVMAEAFRQREAGLIAFDETVTIREGDKLPSCGALTYMHTGLQVTVGDLVTLMIILSDNTATNLLIDRLGIDAVNAQIDRMGLTATRLRRKLFQPELARQGIQNHVSARDMGRLLEAIWSESLVSPAASREMLAILKNQRLNGKLPFYLHSEGIACAHKTGEDDGVTHDVGIIFARTPRIVCFLSERTEVPRAERAIQEIGRMMAMEDACH